MKKVYESVAVTLLVGFVAWAVWEIVPPAPRPDIVVSEEIKRDQWARHLAAHEAGKRLSAATAPQKSITRKRRPVGAKVATYGPNYAGAGTNTTSYGGSGSGPWVNPGNCTADDGADVTFTGVGPSHPDTHVSDNFGFSIPSGENILGILVEIGDKSGSSVEDYVKLVCNSAAVGDNKSSGSAFSAVSNYGGASDDWNASLTYSDVNRTDFGVAIHVSPSPSPTLSFDYVRITIYTDGGLPDAFVPLINYNKMLKDDSMWYLRKSTASQEVPIGPMLDETDGVTPLTGLTIANTDINVFKAGATTLVNKNSGGATHIATGNYYAVFDATDTNTVGPLRIVVQKSGAVPWWIDCVVLDTALYDWWFGSTSPNTTTPLDAAGVRSAVGLGSANLDTQLGDIYGKVDTEVGAIKAKTDQLTFTVANQVDANTLTGGGTGLSSDITAIKAKTDNLPSDPADASVIASSFSGVDTKLDNIYGKVDTEVAAIKAKTDQLTFTVANQVDANALTATGAYICRYGAAFTSSAGTTLKISAWLEQNGQAVVLGSGTCSVTFRENGSGSDLFTITDSAPNAQGIFEMSQSSPGFTSDRLQVATVVIDDGSDTYTTRYAVPIR